MDVKVENTRDGLILLPSFKASAGSEVLLPGDSVIAKTWSSSFVSNKVFYFTIVVACVFSHLFVSVFVEPYLGNWSSWMLCVRR